MVFFLPSWRYLLAKETSFCLWRHMNSVGLCSTFSCLSLSVLDSGVWSFGVCLRLHAQGMFVNKRAGYEEVWMASVKRSLTIVR